MNSELFLTLGKIAGIAGLSIGFLLIIFRSIIQKKIFPTLTSDQSFKIIKLIILLSFAIGLLGICGWFVLENQAKANKHELDKIKQLEPKVSEIATFSPIDSLELKKASFDLNPSPPSIRLRFRSNMWKFSTSFDASNKMLLNDLKFAIIEHFDLMNSVEFDLSKYKTSKGGIEPNWEIRINGRNYGHTDANKTLESLGVKNNDLISFKITWTFWMFMSGGGIEEERPAPPDPIRL